MSTGWLGGLWRRSTAPCPVASSQEEGDARVVQDATRVRRLLSGIARDQTLVTLQTPEGRFAGCARVHRLAACDLWLELRAAERAADPTSSLSAVAPGDCGLLCFTLHRLAPEVGCLLRADCPETLIQVQSRRHFRVGCRMDDLYLTQPGTSLRHRLRDISEEGVGLLLDPGHGATPECTQSHAVLHLGDVTLPVPALQWVHDRPGPGKAAGRWAGARLGGMAPEHVRELRRWLALRQAACLARQPAEV